MAMESTTDRREKLEHYRKSIDSANDKDALISEIDKALSVSEPAGSPHTIESLGRRYKRQSDAAANVRDRVNKVAKHGLPDSWVGSTGAKAGEVVAAAGRDAEQMGEAFQKVGICLMNFADQLKEAKKIDKDGRHELNHALYILDDEDGTWDNWFDDEASEQVLRKAQDAANEGVVSMLQGAIMADESARLAAREMNKYTSEARAGQMSTSELSAADRLVLADTGAAGGPRELNEILSANDLQRSGQRMDEMNATDRAEFEKMLADAKTPEERAYLTKALASGRDMDTIHEFQGKIHGKDPKWLREHLTPVVTSKEGVTDGSTHSVQFKGQEWAQGGDGQEGTCVASSMVTARAMVDPVYALELTGGESGQESDPDTFRERLIAEQHRVHEEGHGGKNWNSMDLAGKEKVAEKEVSPHTGANYDYTNTPNADARRDALPDIEEAVDEGKPVPIGVQGFDEKGVRSGHAMVIVGQEGGMLQIYNPWGETMWVSEDDFVNGHMDKVVPGLPDAYGVHVPR
ncbi:peptidoglycan-binding protein [Streptomyces sp. NPDC101150]|uniref:peptidoglycan-binding protein n=1 Tax=Streptomyces sp. NPDC101150 TaxID=3366114 RepID=UPI003814A020